MTSAPPTMTYFEYLRRRLRFGQKLFVTLERGFEVLEQNRSVVIFATDVLGFDFARKKLAGRAEGREHPMDFGRWNSKRERGSGARGFVVDDFVDDGAARFTDDVSDANRRVLDVVDLELDVRFDVDHLAGG